ncbi:MAG TPA: helix-turn-helix transcriptional regulator [Candidatus Rubneribacter avistercoris]|nr:helix-turn-helix transcriptional regulator [Candidatus Rubneribacter avistercoris]
MRNDDALTADEVAGLLQVSRSTVYKLVKADELASYFIGRKMRFTMADVESYISRSKRRAVAGPRVAEALEGAAAQASAPAAAFPAAVAAITGAFVLAGNDLVGDILANYLAATGAAVDRVYEGSYNALVDVYRGRAHAALAHLYDGEADSYNVEAVKRLVPGTPVKVVRLVRRRQGLIVAKGNPKNLRTWEDLLRPGVRLINRERGCGSRILLDEQLARLGADCACIEGYGREANTALSMASFVARGAADAGIGAERVFHQVEGVDFLPLQNEWLDIVLAKRPGCERALEALARLTRTRPFREEVGAIVGYDSSRMGEVVYER